MADTNNRKLILLVHTSLDGFVAGEKGEFDNFNPGSDNLDFVCSVIDDADAIIAGRLSYQMLETHWSTVYKRPGATNSEIKYSNWYNAARKFVISRTLIRPYLNNTTIIGQNIANEVIKLKQQLGKNILLFGSPSTFQFLDQLGLVDNYCVIVYPVIFGKGIPLFSYPDGKKILKLLSTKQLLNGEIALNYTIDI